MEDGIRTLADTESCGKKIPDFWGCDSEDAGAKCTVSTK